jgi:predicted PurR-regulated permease PerM
VTSDRQVPDPATAARERSAVLSVSWAVRAAAMWAVCLLAVVAAGYVGVKLFERVSFIAFGFILSLFFTAVLVQLVDRLTGLGMNRTLATALVLVCGIAVFALIAWFVIAQITSHASELGDQIVAVANKITDWLKSGPLHLKDSDINAWQKQITDAVRQHQGQLLSGAISTARTVLEVISGLLLALFSTFFLLRDGELVWRWVVRLFPHVARNRMDQAGRRGWQTLGGYVRGQVTIAFIHAVTITVLLLVLRVPLAAALGVLIFLGSFIPIVGLTISGALCVGVALLEHGTGAAIAVAIAIIVLVQVEGHLLQPLIMSRAVHIHPLAIVLAVGAGTALYGIIGALLAVPLTAFTNSFVRGLWGDPRDPVSELPSPDPLPQVPSPAE